MPKTNHPFYGLGVALATPFTAQGNVDTQALARIVQHVIAGGVNILVPLGTTGESVTLTTAEQFQVLDIVFDINQNRLPVLVGCGGNNTTTVQQNMEEFERRYPQLSGFLSVSPYYNKPNQQGIIAHFKSVASATQKPIVLYNVPGRTGSNLTSDTTLTLAHSCTNIVAIKEASGDIEQGMRILRDKPEGFAVLSGDDALAVAQIAVGYEGVISVIGNCLPYDYSKLIKAALTNQKQLAVETQLKLLEVMQLNFAEGNPVGVKCAMSIFGLCEPWVRLPLVPASTELQQKMANALQVLNI